MKTFDDAIFIVELFELDKAEKPGKAINIEYGKIDFENDIIKTVTSTRL